MRRIPQKLEQQALAKRQCGGLILLSVRVFLRLKRRHLMLRLRLVASRVAITLMAINREMKIQELASKIQRQLQISVIIGMMVSHAMRVMRSMSLLLQDATMRLPRLEQIRHNHKTALKLDRQQAPKHLMVKNLIAARLRIDQWREVNLSVMSMCVSHVMRW